MVVIIVFMFLPSQVESFHQEKNKQKDIDYLKDSKLLEVKFITPEKPSQTKKRNSLLISSYEQIKKENLKTIIDLPRVGSIFIPSNFVVSKKSINKGRSIESGNNKDGQSELFVEEIKEPALVLAKN